MANGVIGHNGARAMSRVPMEHGLVLAHAQTLPLRTEDWTAQDPKEKPCYALLTHAQVYMALIVYLFTYFF